MASESVFHASSEPDGDNSSAETGENLDEDTLDFREEKKLDESKSNDIVMHETGLEGNNCCTLPLPESTKLNGDEEDSGCGNATAVEKNEEKHKKKRKKQKKKKKKEKRRKILTKKWHPL